MSAPEHIRAVLEALHFVDGSTDALRNLPNSQWERLLEWCDARQLTLLLHSLPQVQLPDRLREKMASRRTRYALRFERLKQDFFTIADALDRAGLEFCVLKGFSHSPALTPDSLTRAQGDIDLWLQPTGIAAAKQILVDLGYVSIASAKSRHLDPMARPSAWQWRGDRFDPDMPIAVELHYELWSDDAEGVAVSEQQEFWARKTTRTFDGHSSNVLCEPDLLGFAALHLMLHLLHGELPLQRAWEIAYFLHTRASKEDFWRHWRKIHPIDLRRIEAVIFQLVTKWFGCYWPPVLDAELRILPRPVNLWLERFWLSPLKKEWQTNKDEVWLHLALVESRYTKTRVLLKRLLPIHGRRFSFARLRHHAAALVPTFLEGVWSSAFTTRQRQ